MELIFQSLQLMKIYNLDISVRSSSANFTLVFMAHTSGTPNICNRELETRVSRIIR